jgi:hypothetical protein
MDSVDITDQIGKFNFVKSDSRLKNFNRRQGVKEYRERTRASCTCTDYPITMNFERNGLPVNG